MLETILQLATGCAVLLAGSWLAVRAVVGVAAQLRLSPTLAGMTLVPWARVAAPMLAAVVAALMDRPNAALGILVGTITTSAVVSTGVACLISPPKRAKVGTRLVFVSLLAVGLAVIGVIWYESSRSAVPTLSKTEGALLLCVGLIVAAIFLWAASKNRADGSLNAAFAEDASWPVERPGHSVWLKLLLSQVVIVGGAVLVVTSSRIIADRFGLARGVISATVVGAVLSIPQLLNVFRNAVFGDPGVMHTQIGSASLFGLLIGIGVCAWFEPLVLTHQHLYSLLCFACACVGVSIAAMVRSRAAAAVVGVLLLAMYAWFAIGMLRMPPPPPT